MTTMRQVRLLSGSQSSSVALAQKALDLIWSRLTRGGLSKADMIDRLETLVPMLVRKYGDIAGTAADAWYDEARKDTLGEVDGFHASRSGFSQRGHPG